MTDDDDKGAEVIDLLPYLEDELIDRAFEARRKRKRPRLLTLITTVRAPPADEPDDEPENTPD